MICFFPIVFMNISWLYLLLYLSNVWYKYVNFFNFILLNFKNMVYIWLTALYSITRGFPRQNIKIAPLNPVKIMEEEVKMECLLALSETDTFYQVFKCVSKHADSLILHPWKWKVASGACAHLYLTLVTPLMIDLIHAVYHCNKHTIFILISTQGT